jgi:hypothetical protein
MKAVITHPATIAISVFFVGMVVGVAYGNSVPLVDKTAAMLPGSRTKQK